MSLNGLVSFGDAFASRGNYPFPYSSHYLVAPFWIVAEGVISYETHDSGYFLDHVSSCLRKQTSSTFQGTWMVVIYGDRIRPLFGHKV